MSIARRIERIEAAAQRRAVADTRPTELIAILGNSGEVERYDLTIWRRLDDGEQEEVSNGQPEQAT